MDVRLAEAQDASEWNAFVATTPGATSYQRWEWGDLFAREFRLRRRYLVARDGGGVVGVLPLVVQESLPTRRALLSLPYVNYAGPLALHDRAAEVLVQAAAAEVARERATFAELRCLPGVRLNLPVSERKVRPVLELPGDGETLWNSFSTKLRTKIRRPMKEDLAVESGTQALLDDFYRILCIKWRELGSPIYRKGFFAAVLAAFPGEHTLFVLRHGGAAVGALWLHGYGDSVEAVWSGTLGAWDRVKGNMLLYWRAMEWAIDHGFRRFDFGRSTEGGGTHAFKMQWGATSAVLPWYYIPGRATVPPPAAESSRTAALVQAAWKRLPLPLTRVLGPRLARRVPL